MTDKILRENAFQHKKNPRLSANRPSNNWALEVMLKMQYVWGPIAWWCHVQFTEEQLTLQAINMTRMGRLHQSRCYHVLLH